MSETTLANGTTTTPEAPKAKRGFPGLRCLKCHEPDYCHLDLQNLDRVWCASCEDEFSIGADVRPLLEGWSRVLPWLAAAPAAE